MDGEGLDPEQRRAVEHGLDAATAGPLLVVAGAGAGKTRTLVHRVAALIARGADPARVLLLTFTRRAAQEMTRRVRRLAATAGSDRGRRRDTRGALGSPGVALPWSGTFHGIANALLRLHGPAVGLPASFTVLDRSDAEDLMDLVRDRLRLGERSKRFPRKGTCLAIHSHVVNGGGALDATLAARFPWCAAWASELRELFAAYARAKEAQAVLDYDDLLLGWRRLMADPTAAAAVRRRFDHVLVDEYQDTNALQEAILLALAPDGRGLTVVGDDAQAIYSFRAATVRNILDFPRRFDPAATVVVLERNHRSTTPILDACNGVMQFAAEGFAKTLVGRWASGEKPALVAVADEAAQASWVADRVLEHREAGVALRRQAVLMRTAHHGDLLEIELGRRNVPYVKYGGLRFVEAAHVKDVLCLLRWAENPCDELAAFRTLQLLPGMGPRHARAVLALLAADGFALDALARARVPAAAAADWPGFCAVLLGLHRAEGWTGQMGAVRAWYQPQLERLYESAAARASDLDQLEQIALGYPTRERFLTELVLDPPAASGDEAGRPHLDEDYLVLSTIHSAKGREWEAVFVLNVVDGCIPSDMATGSVADVEEERRLLYVAMTRAKRHLHLLQPLRFYVREQHRYGDRYVYAPRTRFLPDTILDRFARFSATDAPAGGQSNVGIGGG